MGNHDDLFSDVGQQGRGSQGGGTHIRDHVEQLQANWSSAAQRGSSHEGVLDSGADQGKGKPKVSSQSEGSHEGNLDPAVDQGKNQAPPQLAASSAPQGPVTPRYSQQLVDNVGYIPTAPDATLATPSARPVIQTAMTRETGNIGQLSSAVNTPVFQAPSAPSSSSGGSRPSAPTGGPAGTNTLMGNTGSNTGPQGALGAQHAMEAAGKIESAAPKEGAGLSQAPQGNQSPVQHQAPAAQTQAPPPAQHAAQPTSQPAAQVTSTPAAATAPMSPGIREGAIPLHQQPANTGYQSMAPQTPATPPAQPGYQQVARGVDPVTGSYANTQIQGNNPYPVPSRAPVFPWQDRDRQKAYLTGAPSVATWWDEAVRMLLKGRRMRGDDDGTMLSRVARLLVSTPTDGSPSWGLTDGAQAPEYAFVFARHVESGPVWYFTSNQGPQLAPLASDGVPAEVRPALESWPGEWSEAMGLFGRCDSAAQAAVLFAEGMQRLNKIDQVYAVVSTEKMGQEVRGQAARLNANVSLSENEHLAETVVLDLPTARASVSGFQSMKLGETAWAHPLASANRDLYNRLNRLANAIPEKGEQGWGAPQWRAEALTWLGTVWIEAALRSAPPHWANTARGWSSFVSAVADALARVEPGKAPQPDADTLWPAFDQDAKAYAPMTLRSARAWLIGDISGVPEAERWQLQAASAPDQAHIRLSRAGFAYDSAWQVVLAWQAARVVGSKAWGAQGQSAQHPQTWINDLGYVMHKLGSGDVNGAGNVLGQLERFEAWAGAYDPHAASPMPDLRKYTT